MKNPACAGLLNLLSDAFLFHNAARNDSVPRNGRERANANILAFGLARPGTRRFPLHANVLALRLSRAGA